MASGSSMMNGDISHPRGSGPGNVGSLEETLQQMNTLIKENRELKGEILKPTLFLDAHHNSMLNAFLVFD